MILPRRAFLIGSTLGWGVSTTTTTTSASSSTTTTVTSSTLPVGEKYDNWADLICTYTPSSFRRAVQQTDRFLYRGVETDDDDEVSSSFSSVNRPRIRHPAPDLLVKGTYEDPRALWYFRCLEDRLLSSSSSSSSVLARPSNGHIATSDRSEAKRWGPVFSVWPLGRDWSFVWPKDRPTFFPAKYDRGNDDNNPAHQNGGIVTDTRTPSPLSSCQEDEDVLVVDADLVEALTQPREVLFASRFDSQDTRGLSSSNTIGKNKMGRISFLSWKSAFIAIPINEDETLRRLLEERNFGL